MKKISMLFGAFIFMVSASVSAAVIDFEDAYAAFGYRGQVGDFYADKGLTVSGNYFGLIGGVSQGDPGNFDLEGTNGPSSLAVNTITHTIDLNFDAVVDLTLDLGIDFGYTSDITIITYAGGAEVSNNMITLTDTLNNGYGTWYDMSWEGVDRVFLEATSGWRAWSIDNLVFETAEVPEPAMIAVLAIGLLGGFAASRKKQK